MPADRTEADWPTEQSHQVWAMINGPKDAGLGRCASCPKIRAMRDDRCFSKRHGQYILPGRLGIKSVHGNCEGVESCNAKEARFGKAD